MYRNSKCLCFGISLLTCRKNNHRIESSFKCVNKRTQSCRYHLIMGRIMSRQQKGPFRLIKPIPRNPIQALVMVWEDNFAIHISKNFGIGRNTELESTCSRLSSYLPFETFLSKIIEKMAGLDDVIIINPWVFLSNRKQNLFRKVFVCGKKERLRDSSQSSGMNRTVSS